MRCWEPDQPCWEPSVLGEPRERVGGWQACLLVGANAMLGAKGERVGSSNAVLGAKGSVLGARAAVLGALDAVAVARAVSPEREPRVVGVCGSAFRCRHSTPGLAGADPTLPRKTRLHLSTLAMVETRHALGPAPGAAVKRAFLLFR